MVVVTGLVVLVLLLVGCDGLTRGGGACPSDMVRIEAGPVVLGTDARAQNGGSRAPTCAPRCAQARDSTDRQMFTLLTHARPGEPWGI